MKNYGKILSIILTICMVMQILPVFAQEAEAIAPVGLVYLINDDFGDDNTAGWSLDVDSGRSLSGTDVSYIKSVDIPGDTGNYALEYTAVNANDARYSHISKVLDTPAVFAEGKDVVIETRLMQTGTGRSFLKMNLVTNPASVDEWNNNYGTLIANDNGTVSVLGDWYSPEHASAPNWNPLSTVATGATNVWYDIKVTIKGTSKTADYEITPDGGETINLTGKAIDYPDAAEWVEDMLKTVDFRMRNANTMYIDYVRAYELLNADMSTDSIITPNDDVVVTIDVAEGNAAFADALTLYDKDGNVVETTNTIDETNKVVTLAPVDMLKEGGKYTIKLDTDAVASNYRFASTEKQIVVSDIAYHIYDDFGKDDLNGWEAKVFDGKTSTNTAVTEEITGDQGNYMLTYTTTDANNSYYGYLSKSITPVTFSNNTDVVVEVRMKQAGTGRSFLKYNLDGTSYCENEWQHNWGLLVQNDGGKVSVLNGWKASASGIYSYPVNFTGSGTNMNIVTGASGEWYTYKVILHGGETKDDVKADHIIYDKDGNELAKREGFTIDFPDNSNWAAVMADGATNANWVEGVLNSVDFRLRNAETINIDYVKVYEEYDVSFTLKKRYRTDEAVVVTFSTGKGSAAFADALALYDKDGNVVETTNTIDETNKVVTLAPVDMLKEGGKYTIKLDTDAVASNYRFASTEKQIVVSDIAYHIYDDFGKDDLNGWEAKVFDGKTSTNTAVTEEITGDQGNYMLTYTTTDANNSYYGYLSKSITPVTFSNNTDVVVEVRMKQAGTGRSFLKYNLDGTSYCENEWQHNWGLLVQNDGGKVSVLNGWKASASGIYSYPVNFTGSGTNMNIVTGASGEWYTYKVILHGGETKDDVKADHIIYDKDGNELAKREGFTIDFPDNSNWAAVMADGATNANWVEGVLNSVDFRLRNAETINIDYVRVYEIGIAQVTLANGRYNKYDEPIVLNVTAEGNGVIIPDASVVLKNGENVIETTAEYNAETGTLTVNHTENLATDGTVYTLTLKDSDYIHFEGTTSFEIEGRDNYETTAVDDDFADGTDGWTAGASNITTTVERDTTTFPGKSVLKITTTDEVKGKDGYQPVAYKKLGNGFKVTEGKNIVIKTSIYQTAENMGRFDLKFNRPNSATQVGALNDFTWMSYNLLRQADSKASLPSTFGKDNFNYGVNFEGLDPVGKWVDYTLTIDGTNKKITATAVADNTTYTAIGVFDLPKDAFEAEYGIGGTPAYVQAINSLTFKNTTASPVYVDYIKVYDNLVMVSVDIDGEIVELGEETEVYATGYEGDFSECVKLYSGETEVTATKSYNSETGTVSIKPATVPTAETTYKLVLDLPEGYDYTGANEFTVIHKPTGTAINESFDGNIDNWTKTNERISGEIKTEGSNNYLQVSASEILKKEAGTTSFTYSMPLDFVMDSDGYTVLEAKIRATGTDYRKMLRINADFTALESAKTTNTPWQINCLTGKVSSTYFCYGNDVENGCPDVMGDYTEGKWYTVRTIYDNVNRLVSFILLDENGNLVSRRTERSMTGGYGDNESNPAAWWFNYKDISRTDREKMRYIDNIALSLRSDATEALAAPETFDIDDIKLYNTENVENLIGYFEVSIIDADGNDITGEGKLPKEGGTFKTNVNYSFGTSKSFSVITALYNGDILETVKVKEYTNVKSVIEAVNEITVSSGIDRTIKVFVWDNISSLVPLMAPVVSTSPETVKVYVSTYGNDENDGSKDAPVASLTAAQEIAKTYDEDVTVLIEDGEYLISEPVNLDYSGEKKKSIAYKAIGDNAEIIAGITLEVNVADKVEEETILGRLVDESAKEHLYVLDLSSYDIPDAALPGVYSHTYLNSAEAPNLVKGQWVTEPKTTCEVFLEDEALTIARYPNKDDATSGYKGYMTVEKIVNAGAVPREWMSDENTVAYADRDITDVFKIGYTDTDGNRMDKWAAAVSLPEKDRPIMYGFWRWDWAVQSVPIAAIDTENNVITSKYPSTYGMLTKTDSDVPASDRRFYVFNLLEEIDERGEYFIDRTNKKLYFYKTDDMNGKRLIISLNDVENALNITGDYTTIDGLKVNTCLGTGIRVAGNNITLVNCEISNTAGFGAAISGYNCTLKDSHIFNVNGGVYVSGGESATFKAANHLIENNEFENFSRVNKLSVPAVQLSGVGNVVSHNEIHNAEHSAIMYGGVNNKIIYNNIYDVCKESDDAGVIYAGRSWVTRGNEIKYNYIHDVASTITGNGGASPIAGIFFDDHLAGGYVEGNIFANIAGDGIRCNAGREHTITNNIFVNCSLRGTRISAPSTDASKFATQENGVKPYIGNETWETKYPILFTEKNGVTVVNTEELMQGNGNTYTKNFAAGCGTPFLFNVNVAESDNSNVSTDVFGGDYSDIAGKVTGIDGFVQIPFAKIRPTTAE